MIAGKTRALLEGAAVAAMLIVAVLLAQKEPLRLAGEETAGPPPPKGELSMSDPENKIVRTDAEWRKLLAPEQYRIARQRGTEPAFTGKYWDFHEKGAYLCAACGQELFGSDAKFDSGCGWPSFSKPLAGARVEEKRDASGGMVRTEIVCGRCGAHLGHVFDDDPAPTGLRYCINSAILDFKKAPEASSAARPVPATATEKATFAAGCFWGVEAAFRELPGVTDTVVGYTGGHTERPSYEQVCSGRTGHAEAVEVSFDPRKISYDQLLEAFWKMHDPTQVNRQGPDVGYQYRSAIFYHDEAQKGAAEASRKRLAGSGRRERPVATSIEPAGAFWKAEAYHQRYVEKHGGAACHL